MISKTLSIIFGVGLIALWVVAISTNGTSAWLTWIDGGIGVLGVIIGLAMTENSPKSLRSGGPIILALCLFALWIIALSVTGTTAWLTWWTFGFGCAFLLTGFSATSTPMTPHRPVTA